MEVSLIQKYNVPGPRYTSYPTVPYWDEANFTGIQWETSLIKSFEESNQAEGISVYIHLPYCESLCTFCACHKRITKQHGVEEPYVDAVLKEWGLYLSKFTQTPIIKELHLGGGTPTFFSPKHLEKLIEGIFATAQLAPNIELSFEGHPNNTTQQHLQTLFNLGFRRVSFGVQDYDLKVQKSINRIQPFTQVGTVTELARNIGYKSISHDLIFGLPFQTWESMAHTIEQTKTLKPDRIAFYSYAHVPWVKGVGQRGFDEADLPSPELKRKLYENGKKLLEDLGYVEIGMDHFALPTDSLYQAIESKTIHRNFMGYSSSSTQLMIGLGMSAISDSWYAFAQNDKSVERYLNRIQQNELPVFRGHILTDEDLLIRRHILNLMCHMESNLDTLNQNLPEFSSIIDGLDELVKDELITINPNKISITPKGRNFIRNVAMAFDMRMLRQQPQTRIFSMTV